LDPGSASSWLNP